MVSISEDGKETDIPSSFSTVPIFSEPDNSSVPVVPDDTSETVSPEKCDVSEDGSVTTADIISLVKMINGVIQKTDSADINNDGSVDVKDLLILINIMKE